MAGEERVEKLREIVAAALGTHRPARGVVTEYIAQKEREFELDGIDTSNIIAAPAVSASGRPRRGVEHAFFERSTTAAGGGSGGRRFVKSSGRAVRGDED